MNQDWNDAKSHLQQCCLTLRDPNEGEPAIPVYKLVFESLATDTSLTLRTSEAGIPALRKLPCGVGSRYTGGTVCQCLASEAGIPALFSNARVIEIQTRQQLKNNFSHETR